MISDGQKGGQRVCKQRGGAKLAGHFLLEFSAAAAAPGWRERAQVPFAAGENPHEIACLPSQGWERLPNPPGGRENGFLGGSTYNAQDVCNVEWGDLKLVVGSDWLHKIQGLLEDK